MFQVLAQNQCHLCDGWRASNVSTFFFESNLLRDKIRILWKWNASYTCPKTVFNVRCLKNWVRTIYIWLYRKILVV